MTSGPSPVASDGVPYVFRSFRYDARLVGLDTGNPSVVPADPPRTRERRLPLDNDIIAFPPPPMASRPDRTATASSDQDAATVPLRQKDQ